MIAVIVAFAAAPAVIPSAQAGFWGDLKESFGTAVDNAQRDGAKAIDAVTGGAGDAADAVVDGAESAADLGTGDSAGDSESAKASATQPHDNTAEPVASESKQLSKQSKK